MVFPCQEVPAFPLLCPFSTFPEKGFDGKVRCPGACSSWLQNRKPESEDPSPRESHLRWFQNRVAEAFLIGLQTPEEQKLDPLREADEVQSSAEQMFLSCSDGSPQWGCPSTRSFGGPGSLHFVPRLSFTLAPQRVPHPASRREKSMKGSRGAFYGLD